jgi:hypothetical protein
MHFASRTVFWDSKAPSNKRRRSTMPFASHANEKAKLGPLSPRDSFLHGRCVRHVPATVVVGAEVEVVLSHRCRRDKAGLWGAAVASCRMPAQRAGGQGSLDAGERPARRRAPGLGRTAADPLARDRDSEPPSQRAAGSSGRAPTGELRVV